LIGRLEHLKSDLATPLLPPRDVAPYWDAVNNQSDFKAWVTQNVTPHKQEGYASVTVSLKAPGQAPGDASAAQMRVLAGLAEQSGFAELRVSHEQNIVLPHVAQSDLMAVFDRLKREGLATPNIGLVSDLIACPGMDYCALATARSIPIGQQIAMRYQHLEPELGPLKIKISGCINACGHHHVGDIGILGLDKAGVENYQITLGGRVGMDAALGEKMGPGFSEPELLLALDRLFEAYLALRLGSDEVFSDTVKRLGTSPFKSALYGVANAA
ncbi:MAG: nitrite/sulfite reductase, partial [Gammaproteobacteria bacterium]|nr:nitrite/sulfite reductase [Gammaproteobacteria bacterium]